MAEPQQFLATYGCGNCGAKRISVRLASSF